MNTVKTQHTDGTIELLITIPWDTVTKTYADVLVKMTESTELPGFRKGKAPQNLVEEKIGKTKIYEEVIQSVVPSIYADAVKKEGLRPIVMPKIELVKAQEKKDWEIKAITCERPTINLGNYKTAIGELKSQKQKKIWTPGQETKPDEKKEDTKPTLDELLLALVKSVKITLPAILIETEVQKTLSDLIDQTKRLGLTVDQYCASTGRTIEILKEEHTKQAIHTLTIEFALETIADTEKITVSEDEITEAIKNVKSEEERKSLEKQRYMVASFIRRQKTIAFLASL